MATVDQITSLTPTIVLPTSRMTLEDYRNWAYSRDFADRGRVNYVNGRLFIEMSPGRINSHTRTATSNSVSFSMDVSLTISPTQSGAPHKFNTLSLDGTVPLGRRDDRV